MIEAAGAWWGRCFARTYTRLRCTTVGRELDDAGARARGVRGALAARGEQAEMHDEPGLEH